MTKQAKIFAIALTAVILVSGVSVSLAEETNIPVPTTTASVSQEAIADETVNATDLGVNEPTLLPDSKWYFLKNWGRNIHSFFTFDKVKKAELKLRYSSEDLLGARKLASQRKKGKIIEKATKKYQQSLEQIKQIVDKIKNNASTSPEVNKFLDKFTQKQALHMRILDKLSAKDMSSTTLKIITNAKQAQLKRFREVMLKLESKKGRIGERLEKNLEKIKGSKFKQFKNLEVLKRIEDKMPEQAKKAIKQARERAAVRLKNRIEQMTPEAREKFQNYVEQVKGKAELKMEILQDLKQRMPNKLDLQNILENTKNRIQRRTKNVRKSPCSNMWKPVCGINNKTYANECWAKELGVKIAKQGICQNSIVPNPKKEITPRNLTPNKINKPSLTPLHPKAGQAPQSK